MFCAQLQAAAKDWAETRSQGQRALAELAILETSFNHKDLVLEDRLQTVAKLCLWDDFKYFVDGLPTSHPAMIIVCENAAVKEQHRLGGMKDWATAIWHAHNPKAKSQPRSRAAAAAAAAASQAAAAAAELSKDGRIPHNTPKKRAAASANGSVNKQRKLQHKRS